MTIQESVSVLLGVGPKRAQTLADLGILTIEDLLSYYPFRYEDIQEKFIRDQRSREGYIKRCHCLGTRS